MHYIRRFETIGLNDIALVGGKNSSLGQLTQDMQALGIAVPSGFAITAEAYRHFILVNNLDSLIASLLENISLDSIESIQKAGAAIRHAMLHAEIPADLSQEIATAYQELCQRYSVVAVDVAVRSSATAEDLPTASFAGQQESFLNISGTSALLVAYKQCLASLFTDRAISYRLMHGFDHTSVAISVGVQKMVRSDKGCSGVAFSLDPESGLPSVVVIEAIFGLGELLVKGQTSPDEYWVSKPLLQQGFSSITKKLFGSRAQALRYGASGGTELYPLTEHEKNVWCLLDMQIEQLAKMVCTIEKSYSEINGAPTPMDIEWALDGIENKLYIVQARPETVHRAVHEKYAERYQLAEQQISQPILSGTSVGQKIATGTVVVIKNVHDASAFQAGDVLVTQMTDPDWVPLIRKAAAVVTDLGGRTCHAAIVSRELGIPAIVGTGNATTLLTPGTTVTIDCSQGLEGRVYEGNVPFTVSRIDLATLKKPEVSLMVNVADPDQACVAAQLPHVAGVGLARIEFIIAHQIGIHPMACATFEQLQDQNLKKAILEKIRPYISPQEFFIQQLAYGIASIAAAFYPRPVQVRFSDFKTNEYAHLLGGELFEQVESNPMMGLRGAARYYNVSYQAAFALECAAIRVVRENMGLINVIPMVPFIRTPQEAAKVIACLQENGIERSASVKLCMMVEIPSNIILFEQFAPFFDYFSIGSNDLTQFTLAIDRDCAALAADFSEENEAVVTLVNEVIAKVHLLKKPIGICGQAPSDNYQFARLLIASGIDSISLNPDSVLSFLQK